MKDDTKEKQDREKNGRLYAQVLDPVVSGVYFKATKYMTPTHVIRAVRKRFKKKILKRGNVEITLTIGKPNFIEREYIKKLKAAKEPFPVKKVQLK